MLSTEARTTAAACDGLNGSWVWSADAEAWAILIGLS
jgi:hypothetical protein